MWTEKDTLGRMGNAHGTEKGKQGLKRASWELERHTHCWKGHVWRLEKHIWHMGMLKRVQWWLRRAHVD